jgi:hypothetical protein
MDKTALAFLLAALVCLAPIILCILLGIVLHYLQKNKSGTSYDPGSINTNTEKEITNDE